MSLEPAHQDSVIALDTLFAKAIISFSDFGDNPNMPKPTAVRIFKVPQDQKVLEVIRLERGKTPGIVVYSKLLEIVEV
ncbi:MAG: hypothetical protein WDZ27_06880 [Waddliaceae bacterium]